MKAKIITLRAIALKLLDKRLREAMEAGEDHNATSYSTETAWLTISKELLWREDHNATSYSTETSTLLQLQLTQLCEDHNATSYSTETAHKSLC